MALDPRNVVTVVAPNNIAVIKYWGKDLARGRNTPINSSASVTLDTNDLRATTTVGASQGFADDRLFLNGAEEAVSQSPRFQSCLREIRKIAGDRVDKATGEVLIARQDWPRYRVHIVSENNFPTAAGLASSAAGYAALVFALAELFCAKEAYEGQLSTIARQGSGSACRSLYGGFVAWRKGSKPDASDSMAVQLSPASHWNLRAVVLVVNAGRKDTASTLGMNNSVATSPLLAFRAREVVDGRLAAITAAYRAKDFATFGKITMQDSNQFHATCLDTYPPIFYLNDTSRQIIRLVDALNAFHGVVVAAYTYDAGPNAVIYVEPQHEAQLVALMYRYFPAPGGNAARYCNKPEALRAAVAQTELPAELVAAADATGRRPAAGDCKMMYLTGVGEGPKVLAAEASLMDPHTGLPRKAGAAGPGPGLGLEGRLAWDRTTVLIGALSTAVAAGAALLLSLRPRK